MTKRISGLVCALFVIGACATPSWADPPKPPPGAVDRAESCELAAKSLCTATAMCRQVCRTCDVRDATLRECLDYERLSCRKRERPQRPWVSAADFGACGAALRQAPRTVAACREFLDEEHPPECESYYAEVAARDYRPEPGRECAPGYMGAAGLCLLTCRVDGDCRPRYEVCGQAGVCEPARRK